MKKLESTFVNMTLSLTLIVFIASGALALVYSGTKEAIAISQVQAKVDSLKQVLPQFDNNPLDAMSSVNVNGVEVAVYVAKLGETLVGMAVEAMSAKGYGGDMVLMVGFLPDGTIHNVAVLSHKETPGLGSKIEPGQSDFIQQFKGLQPIGELSVKKDSGDIDAITAATISSRAFCDAVNMARDAFLKGNN